MQKEDSDHKSDCLITAVVGLVSESKGSDIIVLKLIRILCALGAATRLYLH